MEREMIKIGDRLPDAMFKVRIDDGYGDMTTADVFSGKKIVLFAVPGAFTPTCTVNHLPGYLENHDEILAKGVDAIAVAAVNDHHVMNAWAKASGGEGKIIFLADGAALFTKALGVGTDMGPLGFRSRRYSMIVVDGVVKQFNLETGHGADVSGAAAILGQL
jgi:glutaredoxin/glutathione-dependent peroxiredoxin